MIITANNPSYENAEKTLLTDPVSSSATTLKVKNTQGFNANDYIVIGEIGTEKAEIVQISAIPSDTQLTIGATKFSHNEGDPVAYSKYNQVRFYMATSLAGTYSVQTTVAIEVDNSDKTTRWDDTDGLSTYYYKVSYYNSTSTVESSLSDPIPGSGIARNTVRNITDEILREAKDTKEALVNRDEVMGWMNECQDDLWSRKRKWSFLYNRAVANRVGSQAYYSISSAFGVTDCDTVDHLDYNYVSGTTDILYRLRYVTKEEYDRLTEDRNASESDELQKWTWDEATDYIRVYPTPDTSSNTVFYLYYYKKFTELNSDGDTLEIPDVRIYKFYCLYRFYLKKENDNIARFYQAEYERGIVNLMRKERKEIGQPRGFKYYPDNERRFYKY